MFKRKNSDPVVDNVEMVFNRVADLTKDLSKAELKRFIDGVTLTWEAWQKIRQSRPAEEREEDEIITIEKTLNEQ